MTDYTTNLDIALLDSNVAAPEDVVNDALNALDSKITAVVVCAFGSNTLALTKDQQALGSILHLTVGSPGPSGAVTLNLAAGISVGNFTVVNDSGQDATIQLSGQSLAAPVVTAGSVAVLNCDGSNVRAPGAVSGSSTADISFLIDGGGSAIATGMKGYIEVPFACTIQRATLLADQSGSIVVDIFKCTYSQFDAGSTHPVSGDKITASAPPTISSATKAQDSTLTGWTKTINAGDILAFNVNSITTVTRVTLSLKVSK